MPELPEIRVHAERLERLYAGAVLESIEPLSFTALKSVIPPLTDLAGRTVTTIGSRGKLFLLDAEGLIFVVHLMQGGRLTPDARNSKKPRGGLVRWRFETHDPLLLTEAGKEHRAGVWVAVADELDTLEPLEGLGPDIDALDRSAIGAVLTEAGGSRLHGVLRDQRRWAGVGRRLANEICWVAGLSPFARATSISGDDLDRLTEAIGTVIDASITDERTRDEMVRSADRVASVHRRMGEPCPRCGDTIRAVSYRSYEVDYCPTCQTGGRTLADNTTSKFLK